MLFYNLMHIYNIFSESNWKKKKFIENQVRPKKKKGLILLFLKCDCVV